MINFELNEFSSPDLPNSGINMHFVFLDKLDKARTEAGIPFKINSGYRTENHNKKVKGKFLSSHLIGRAADIHCTDSRSRWIIVKALINQSFSRIGIANTFIHVDDDPDKSACVWLY